MKPNTLLIARRLLQRSNTAATNATTSLSNSIIRPTGLSTLATRTLSVTTLRSIASLNRHHPNTLPSSPSFISSPTARTMSSVRIFSKILSFRFVSFQLNFCCFLFLMRHSHQPSLAFSFNLHPKQICAWFAFHFLHHDGGMIIMALTTYC